MRRTLLPVVAAAALTLGACSPDDEPAPAPATASDPSTTTPSASTEPTATGAPAPAPSPSEPAEAAEPVDPTDEAPDLAGADFSEEEQRNPEHPSSSSTDGVLFVTDVRTGSHDGFERVVLDFEGTGAPGWSVRYTEDAVPDESGEVGEEVDLDGAFILRVDLSGVAPPLTDGQTDFDQMARGFYDVEGVDLLRDVYLSGWFEGWSSALIGLDERTPFRVLTLTDPTRLVIDVSTGEP